MSIRKQKKKEDSGHETVNTPFVVNPIDGKLRLGLTDGVTHSPLAVQVIGKDGLPPHDKDGKPVSLDVKFETIRVPEGAETNLVSGTRRTMTLKTDTDGRAYVAAQLGRKKGAYLFRISLPDFPHSVDGLIKGITEGAVSSLLVLPVKPVPVDTKMKLSVKALDWQGLPVEDANLEAGFIYTFQPEKVNSFKARPARNGTYNFALKHTISGKHTLHISDTLTDNRTEVQVEFLPGKVRHLNILKPENPRHTSPYNQTRLDVVATDRYGNLVPHVQVEWEKSSGSIFQAMPSPGTSASSILKFGKQPEVKVTARAENKLARLKVELPGVYLRFAEIQDFTFTENPFKVWVDVFPPPGAGTLRSIYTCLKEPVETARRLSVVQPNPENGIPAPEIIDKSDGHIDICIDNIEIRIPESGGRYTIAELQYTCLGDNPACFETLGGTVTIAHSPEQEHQLHPGTEKCRPQKLREPQKLCLNFCIVNKPGGKTMEQLQNDARAQVTRAQEIFDENIQVCCPKIEISACYNELAWNEYNDIVKDGEQAGVLEQVDYTNPLNNDSTKDKFDLSQEVKDLLKKCRKDDCLTIYYVPEHKYKSGGTWYPSNGVGISPNDFPETTGAADSGSGIILTQGISLDNNTLAHELGHNLIDLPRNENEGAEHVDSSETDRLMKAMAPAGRKLTKEECSRIYSNISSYSGNCE